MEKEFIERRIKTIEKHQRFWTENNLKFIKEKNEFLENSKFKNMLRWRCEKEGCEKLEKVSS